MRHHLLLSVFLQLALRLSGDALHRRWHLRNLGCFGWQTSGCSILNGAGWKMPKPSVTRASLMLGWPLLEQRCKAADAPIVPDFHVDIAWPDRPHEQIET